MPTKTRSRSRSTSGNKSKSSTASRSRKPDRAKSNEAPVAARAQLDAGEGRAGLDEVAKRQEKEQAEALNNPPASFRSDKPDNVSEARAPSGANGVGPVGARVDQLTARGPGDVLQGHFCTIDRTHKDVDADLLPEGQDGYGVYVEPAEIGADGYPVSALVRLRDDSHRLVKVPYDSLRPAAARGR